MANTLKFKRGLVGTIPTAALGEPLFTTDTFDLYIGNGTGNTRFQKFIASGTTSQLLRGDGSLLTMPIVLTSPSTGQVLKYNGTSWVNDSDAGITGSGTTNYLPKFTGASTLGNSRIFDNGTNVGIGLITPDVELAVYSASVSRLHLQNSTSGVSATDGLQFAISGADGYIWNWENGGLFLATNNTQRARITSGGNFIINNASTDNGLRFQVTGDGYFSGSVGIGSTSPTAASLRLSKTIAGTGGTFGYGILQEGVIQSNVTSFSMGFYNLLGTQAASFTLNNYYHYFAQQSILGAGSAVNNQYGYFVQNTLTGATNNFGFYGDIASGTGRWNLYMNGTAANFLNGNTGIGRSPGVPLDVAGTIRSVGSTGASSPRINLLSSGFWTWGIYGDGNNLKFQNDATDRLTLNSDGNLGLGVTPSAWDSAFRALQVRNVSLANFTSNTTLALSNNGYFNTDWRYVSTAAAAMYVQSATAQHIWYNAPSGTAGNAITFTQAMTLDASGSLMISQTTSLSSVYKLQVGDGTADTRAIFKTSNPYSIAVSRQTGGNFYIGATTAASPDLIFSNNAGSEVMRLANTGNLLVGTTTDAGFKLDVNGTMRVSGASTFGGIMTLTGAYISLNANGYIRTDNANFLTLQSGSSGFVVKNSGNANDNFVVNNSGAGTFLSSATATSFIAASSQPNTSDYNYLVFNNLAGGYGDWNIYKSGANNLSLGYGTDGGTTYTNALTFTYGAGATFSSSVTTTPTTGGTGFYANGAADYSVRIVNTQSAGTFYGVHSVLNGGGGTKIAGYFTATGAGTNYAAIFDGGNVGIGISTPAQKLDVTGSANSIQARFGNVAGRGLTIGTSAISGTNDAGVVFNAPTATDGTLIFQTTSVERARISGSGNLLINTTSDTGYKLRVNGTSYFDDNLRFPNLKGCVFVQTGGSLLGSIAMDSANAVTIDNNGFAGLSVGGSYTMTGGNLGIGHSAFGTSATKTISVNSGTAPSTSPADAFQLYSADITAGNAAPHFRTENGGIIKLYQQTTGVTSATYIGGAGTTVTDLDTFDGYTIPQIVKALRNAGLLA